MNGTQTMRQHINQLEAVRRIMRQYIIADLAGNEDAKRHQVKRLERLGEMPRVLKREQKPNLPEMVGAYRNRRIIDTAMQALFPELSTGSAAGMAESICQSRRNLAR